MRVAHSTFYHEYEYDAVPAGVGFIVKVYCDGEYIGSYFSMNKHVPRGSCYNAGVNAMHESFRNA